MGSYQGGVYVPAIGETGWGAQVSDSQRQLGLQALNVKAAPFGALGDGVTDDSPAIQTCLDSLDGQTIFFPKGEYRIGTPLRFNGSVRLLGEYARQAYSHFTHLKPLAPNDHLFAPSSTSDFNHVVFEGMVFRGNSGRTDTCFLGTASGGNNFANVIFLYNQFRDFKYDFDFDTAQGHDTGYLINTHIGTRTNGFTRLNSGFINDNHWTDCRWVSMTGTGAPSVPVVTLGRDTDTAQGNWFQDCYMESFPRQAILFNNVIGGVFNTYTEDNNRDIATYTNLEGLSYGVPLYDINGANSRIHLKSMMPVLTGAFVGSTLNASPLGHLIYDDGVNNGASTPSSYTTFDGGGLRVVHTPGGFVTTHGTVGRYSGKVNPTMAWSGNTVTPHALYGDHFEICAASGDHTGVDITVANPLSATRGRKITFDFAIDAAQAPFTSVTLGAAFKTTAAVTVPAAGNRRLYTFWYDGTNWIETYRSPADIPL